MKYLLRMALLLALVTMAPVVRGAEGVHWTILGPHSVAFAWRGPEATIDFATDGTSSRRVTARAPVPLPDPPGAGHQEAVLTGLLPNALYRYRIGAGPEHTFRTPPLAGSSGFWFAVQADIGSSFTYDHVAPTQAQVAADEPGVPGDDRPRFVLAAGDLTYGDQYGLQAVDSHFDDVQVWSRDAAYMPSWGNHEWQCSSGCTRPDDLNNYEGRFVLPNTQSVSGAAAARGNGPADDWGWFDYGNTRFISMPTTDMSGALSEWASAVAPIMAQAQSDPAVTFIVVYGHFPAWSSGSDHGGDSSIQSVLKSLRTDYFKLVLAIQGHSHHYERWSTVETGGLMNIVAGGGGSGCGGLQSSAPAGSEVRWNELHHLKLQVLPDRIEGWVVCGPSGSSSCGGQCQPGAIIDFWTIGTGAITAVNDPPPPPALREGVFYDVAGRRVEKPLRSGVYFRLRGQVREVVIVR